MSPVPKERREPVFRDNDLLPIGLEKVVVRNCHSLLSPTFAKGDNVVCNLGMGVVRLYSQTQHFRVGVNNPRVGMQEDRGRLSNSR